MTTFHEVNGLTREQLRQRISEASRLRLVTKQREVDEQLLALGREFQREQAERERARLAKRQTQPAAPPKPPVELAQHRQPERCGAFHCPNAATIDVEVVVGGEVVRRGFCDPHAAEYLVERTEVA